MTDVRAHLTRAREAQLHWRAVPIGERLQVIREVRGLIATQGAALATAAGEARQRPAAETLTAEVIPLAAACEFLEKRAEGLLCTRRLGKRGRPLWLAGVASEIRREPYGVVLIVGPANYPLFLPGVQLLQALVAGNAVLLKPGRSGTAAMEKLLALLHEAALPKNLVQLLPEPPEQVHRALDAGVDLVVFTGSTAAGRQVISAAAGRTVPIIAELSGEDPVFIREDADLALAEKAIRFGHELNGGDSCIAPRRIFSPAGFASQLTGEFPNLPVQQASDDHAGLRLATESSYALGASIFSRDEAAALRLAERVNAGVVVINDCIMPTADPRLPFGGRGASGYGVTRGAEGLLALTRPKVITIQRGARMHLRPGHASDADFFLAYLQAAHSRTWRERWQAGLRLMRLGKARTTTSSST